MTGKNQVKGQRKNQVKGERLKVKGMVGCSSQSGGYFFLSPFGFYLGFQS